MFYQRQAAKSSSESGGIQTASNGLTAAGDPLNVKLGGTLQDALTDIALNGNNLRFIGSTVPGEQIAEFNDPSYIQFFMRNQSVLDIVYGFAITGDSVGISYTNEFAQVRHIGIADRSTDVGMPIVDEVTQKGLQNAGDYSANAVPFSLSQISSVASIVARSAFTGLLANQSLISYTYNNLLALGEAVCFRISGFVVVNSGVGTAQIDITWLDPFDVVQTATILAADMTKVLLIQVKSSGNITADAVITGTPNYSAGAVLEFITV